MRTVILTPVTKLSGFLLLLMVLSLAGGRDARALTTESLACSPEYQIVQTFPNAAKWEMCWEPRAGYGYRLSQIIFTHPNGVRRKILDTLHIAQLFVPYDDNGARFRDIGFGKVLETLAPGECPGGSLLTNSLLCLAQRPHGYAYKNVSAGSSSAGKSFAVFGYIAFSSYNYVMQYSFFDDGSIEPSVGATGSLARWGGTATTGWPIGQNGDFSVSHNHLLIWRMDFDLDGASNTRVERVSFAGSGSDHRPMSVTPLTSEIKELNSLSTLSFWRVRNTAQNNLDGRNISYEIEPSVTDVLRAPEDFTQNDFYLTQYKAAEELVDSGLVGFVNGEAITDPVIWYGVNFHHVPRGEDDVKMPVHWQGFRIRPRDVTTAATEAGNARPVLTNPGSQASTVNSSVNLPIQATDANGADVLTYTVTGLPTGLAINSHTGVISGTALAAAGTYNVTVTVSDGHAGGTASTSFTWTVTAVGQQTQTFSTTTPVAIRDLNTAAPYPLAINVGGLSGTISSVRVTLNGLSHSCGRDMDILLVGPGGQKSMLMSDAGGCVASAAANVTFDASAAQLIPQNTVITSGYYRPADYDIGPADSFPAPGPAAPYPASLGIFNGTAPNGAWNLYVVDDASGDSGQIANGVTLEITTVQGTGTGNSTPTITNPGTQVSVRNATISLKIVAADRDAGDTLTFSASGLPAGLTIDNRTGIISGVTTAAGTYNTNVTVSDGHPGGTASASFVWTVSAGGGGSQTQSFTAPGPVTIRDVNTALPYPVTVTVSNLTGTVTNVRATLNGLTHTCARDLDILLVGPGGQKSILMSDAGACLPITAATVAFDATAATFIPDATEITTGVYKPANYVQSDQDNFPSPGPGTPNPTGLSAFNGTAPNGDWQIFIVDDAGGDVGQIANGVTLTLTTQGGTNTPPVITNPGPQTSAPNASVNLKIVATDANPGDTLSYSAAGLPAGLSINNGTGIISGTATTVGAYNATVTVSDGHPGGTASASFTWTVQNAVNVPPVISNPGAQTSHVNNIINLKIDATDANSGDMLSYSATGLPPGLSIDSNTGVISGTLNQSGNYDVMAIVSDGHPGGIATISFSWTVDSVSNSIPVITNPGAQTSAVNASVSLNVTASDANVGDVLSFTATGLPDGLSINSGTGIISGVPSTAGNFNVTVTVSDGHPGGTASASFNWAVNPVSNSIPVITNPGAQTTPQNTSVNLNILATDADVGDVLSYSATGLPDGLSINSGSGVISGVPSTAGNYNVTVTVSDGHPSGAATASTSFVWTISLAGGGQNQSFTAPGAITIRDVNTALPYPVVMNVSGMTGIVSKVRVTLNGLTHTCGRDLDILLVGPGGQKSILMSDAGGCLPISAATVGFEATATAAVPGTTAISTGIYQPRNYVQSDADNFPAPGPGASNPTDLTVFNGTAPNGVWKVFIIDDAGGDIGQIANGVTLDITTAQGVVNSVPVIVNPGTQTSTVNHTVNLNTTATDNDVGDVLVYSATGLPSGISINSNTGLISGTASIAGNFNVTVTVSDGHPNGSATASFSWTVTAEGEQTQNFSAPAAITIPDVTTSLPYPVTVNVSGMTGLISNVRVTLSGLTHTCGRDLDILLVGPGGQQSVLMSDAGGCSSISEATVAFDANATVVIPSITAIASGVYKPANYDQSTADYFPSPAPSAPYLTDLKAFNGTSPNGEWKLFIVDDAAEDTGIISNGITLTISAQ